jgi:glycosyltransferase involved in cell wall biosynthesis
MILEGVDAVYAVSEHGKYTLQARWPRWADRIDIARLGVGDPSYETPASRDGVLRVVSCSFLVPVKRVDLLIRALAHLGRQRPDMHILWSHLGDGPLSFELRGLAARVLPANVEARFLGEMTHRSVLDFYRSQPVDIFVNVSASEGVPVSIMEAQSFGIPVVATAVGGTPEIVTDSNGCLLPPNPGSDEIAGAIEAFHGTDADAREKRVQSRRMWSERYNADINFPKFSRILA